MILMISINEMKWDEMKEKEKKHKSKSSKQSAGNTFANAKSST